jgi:Cu/Ag efflux protein CusF
MKRLILLVALLALVGFISGAIAQPKPTEKPAPAPAPAAPEKPKLEKFSGAIEKVDEVAKTLEVKHKVKKEEKTLAFAIDDKTKITRGKGTLSFSELKTGMQVSIEYKKAGDKNVAAAIKVAVTKAQPKKTEGKKPAEPEKK